MPGAGGDVNTTLPLVLNIVAFLLCGYGLGCVTWALSIIGIVFAVQAGSAKSAGDLVTAKGKAKTSLILGIVGLALGALTGLGYLVLVVLANPR